MKNITINGATYGFTTNFKHDSQTRSSFNALTRSIFDFDFEDYYQNGYWNDGYIPHALLHGGRVVANVAVNILDFYVFGKAKRYIQIGTVMTDEAYRNRGLSKFLLQTVLDEWRGKSDLIYLFANDTVLDFYPRFGFCKKTEYQYTKALTCGAPKQSTPPLDMKKPENRALLLRLSGNTCCFSALSPAGNTGLVMFYATSFYSDRFYYLEALDTAVFARYENDTLHLDDIFCSRDISLEAVILTMSRPGVTRVVLGFTPPDTTSWRCERYFEADNTLFVLAANRCIFDEHRLMFPLLSHA